MQQFITILSVANKKYCSVGSLADCLIAIDRMKSGSSPHPFCAADSSTSTMRTETISPTRTATGSDMAPKFQDDGDSASTPADAKLGQPTCNPRLPATYM